MFGKGVFGGQKEGDEGLGLKEGTVENMDDDREERGLNFEEKIFEMKDEGPTQHNACVDKGGGCCIVGCSYGPKGEMDKLKCLP